MKQEIIAAVLSTVLTLGGWVLLGLAIARVSTTAAIAYAAVVMLVIGAGIENTRKKGGMK